MGKMASKNWLVKKKQQDRAKEQWNMGIHCWYVLSRVLAWLSPGLGQARLHVSGVGAIIVVIGKSVWM